MSGFKLIGIAGPARSGKDTVAEYLVSSHGFKRYAFADPIRECVARILGVPFHMLLDGNFKETPIEPFGKSPRYMMQTLGTEWGREMVYQNIWLEAALPVVNQCRQNDTPLVIPDIRFNNEASFIRSLGGEIWHLMRPNIQQVEAHSSENGVRVDITDYTLFNTNTIEFLWGGIDALINPPQMDLLSAAPGE